MTPRDQKILIHSAFLPFAGSFYREHFLRKKGTSHGVSVNRFLSDILFHIDASGTAEIYRKYKLLFLIMYFRSVIKI